MAQRPPRLAAHVRGAEADRRRAGYIPTNDDRVYVKDWEKYVAEVTEDFGAFGTQGDEEPGSVDWEAMSPEQVRAHFLIERAKSGDDSAIRELADWTRKLTTAEYYALCRKLGLPERRARARKPVDELSASQERKRRRSG
jgi:hypothetical protein